MLIVNLRFEIITILFQIEIPVALKTISDACEMSWKKEVSIFTSLNQSHSSIIKFYGLLIGERDEVRMVSGFYPSGIYLL